MGEISDWIYDNQVLPKSHATGWEPSKTVIIQEEKPKGMNTFQVFYIWSRSSCA
jgi:hypothetical protein